MFIYWFFHDSLSRWQRMQVCLTTQQPSCAELLGTGPVPQQDRTRPRTVTWGNKSSDSWGVYVTVYLYSVRASKQARKLVTCKFYMSQIGRGVASRSRTPRTRDQSSGRPLPYWFKRATAQARIHLSCSWKQHCRACCSLVNAPRLGCCLL